MKTGNITRYGACLPVFEISKVSHIGYLDGYRPRHHSSLEGDGLSVSTCPDAWLRIARLGDLPRWDLRKQDGVFLDMLSLDPKDRRNLLNDACKAGLLVPMRAWEVRLIDDEADPVSFLYGTMDEAKREAADADASIMKPVRTHGAGHRFRYGPFRHEIGEHVEDVAILQLLDEEKACDGLWWSERLDPAAFSAPRGAIFPSRLKEWKVTAA